MFRRRRRREYRVPGTVPPRRFVPRLHYELLVCGLRGHELIGTDAAELRRSDAVVVREMGGVRWHRCLRCDSWLPLPPPRNPTRRHPPEREEVELPLRGKALGLWYQRRWAEYLTFVATTAFLPLEVLELTNQVSAFKVTALIVNLAVVIYLLFAKRLFGLRGGAAADERERARDQGWPALERTAPPLWEQAAAAT